MTLILKWIAAPARLRLQWLVNAENLPAGVQQPLTIGDVELLAVVLAPPGQNAGDTLDGDRGDIRIQSGQWLIGDIDGGTFN